MNIRAWSRRASASAARRGLPAFGPAIHELTTQIPFQVWLAIDVKARLPKVENPPLRIVRFSGPALNTGIEKHLLQGVFVPITVPAYTVPVFLLFLCCRACLDGFVP